MIYAPVLHVNGDHPEGKPCVFLSISRFDDAAKKMLPEPWILRLSIATTLGKTSLSIFLFIEDGELSEIFIHQILLTLVFAGGWKFYSSRSHSDLNYCFRHNELDIPNITSPLMYEQIATRKSVPQLYEEKLIVSFLCTPPVIGHLD